MTTFCMGYFEKFVHSTYSRNWTLSTWKAFLHLKDSYCLCAPSAFLKSHMIAANRSNLPHIMSVSNMDIQVFQIFFITFCLNSDWYVLCVKLKPYNFVYHCSFFLCISHLNCSVNTIHKKRFFFALQQRNYSGLLVAGTLNTAKQGMQKAWSFVWTLIDQ